MRWLLLTKRMRKITSLWASGVLCIIWKGSPPLCQSLNGRRSLKPLKASRRSSSSRTSSIGKPFSTGRVSCVGPCFRRLRISFGESSFFWTQNFRGLCLTSEWSPTRSNSFKWSLSIKIIRQITLSSTSSKRSRGSYLETISASLRKKSSKPSQIPAISPCAHSKRRIGLPSQMTFSGMRRRKYAKRPSWLGMRLINRCPILRKPHSKFSSRGSLSLLG